MVEVFKTDVANCDDAKRLIDQLYENFNQYVANFDLEDCDLILRIECSNGSVNAESIIEFLKEKGFKAEVLPDDLESTMNLSAHFSAVQSSDFSEK
jgi:peptide subunit release factor 1 (eRF1)